VTGLLLAFAAAIGATITFFFGAKVSRLVDPLTLVFQLSVIGLLLTLPLVWHQFQLPSASGYLPLATATGCYICAIICQFSALGRLSPAVMGFIMNLEPVVSILAARIWLNEIPGTLQWMGIVMVLAALGLSAKLLPAQTAN
jgi:drug/metabolite transporter (DMT)-like permease